MNPAAPQDLPLIVIVDDQPDDVFLLRRRLRSAHVPNPVLAFTDPAKAKDCLERSAAGHERRVGLLITDLKMPAIDGLDLTAWVRAHPTLAELPVVMISGGDQPRDRLKALETGVTAFFSKFPSSDEIAQAIAHAAQRYG